MFCMFHSRTSPGAHSAGFHLCSLPTTRKSTQAITTNVCDQSHIVCKVPITEIHTSPTR